MTTRYCGTTGEHCATSGCQPLYGTCNGNEVPLGNAVVVRSSTASIQRVKFGSVPYGGSQVTGIKDCTTKGVIALTFDDGPSTYTKDLLDLLDRYNAKATFFISKDPQSSDSQYQQKLQRAITAEAKWMIAQLVIQPSSRYVRPPVTLAYFRLTDE